MNTLFGNMPYFCLLWMGVGFIFLMIGIFMLARQAESDTNYTEKLPHVGVPKEDSMQKVEELFSYFLEEEEKKNTALRESMQNDNSSHPLPSLELEPKTLQEEEKFHEVIKHYNAGKSAKQIAKELKMGVGEVTLILSLYTMR
ncbi:MAG: hypothetical protein AB9856_19745 [Cellulosilyticaceae bacterium]